MHNQGNLLLPIFLQTDKFKILANGVLSPMNPISQSVYLFSLDEYFMCIYANSK